MRTAVSRLWDDVGQTLAPGRDAKDGWLPPLLVGMTVITGLVDAFSYLALGHVFVANMTGNVVFLAFALVGVAGFSVAPSLVALAAFLLGAAAGGILHHRLSDRLGRRLSIASLLELILLAAAALVSAAAGGSAGGAVRYALIAVLAVALGAQNATARGLAVPDLTTTVLTLTLTGIASDARAVGGGGSRAGRRLVSVAAMLGGALVGGMLVLRGLATAPLVIGAGLMAIIAAMTRVVPLPVRP